MFDSLKAMGAIAGLMKNKDALKAAGERIQTRLAELRASGQAGGSAVRVIADGRMRIIEVNLDPALARHAVGADGPADAGIADLAGSLIAEAVNEAIRQAQIMAHREMQREAQALGLPDMPGLDKLFGP